MEDRELRVRVEALQAEVKKLRKEFEAQTRFAADKHQAELARLRTLLRRETDRVEQLTAARNDPSTIAEFLFKTFAPSEEARRDVAEAFLAEQFEAAEARQRAHSSQG